MHFQQVGGAGNAQRRAGCDDDEVAALQHVFFHGAVHRMLKQFIHIGFFFRQQGRNAPGQVHLPPGGLIGGAADNGAGRAVFGDHAGRRPGFGHGNDGFGAHIVRGGYSGVGDGVGYIRRIPHLPHSETANIIDVVLRTAGDPVHRFERFDGMRAGGGFTGQHDGAGAIVNGVGHVGCFRPGGTGILHHGLQHLGGGDYLQARVVGLVNQHLLQAGDLLQGNFHPHVAARDHDAVGYFDNTVYIGNALGVFYFGNNTYFVVVVPLQLLPDLYHVIGPPGKGGGDKIRIDITGKRNV